LSRATYDVVIIGSGAGGGSSAWSLSKQGFNVLVLEAGPGYDPFSEYDLHSSSWEAKMFPHKIPTEGRQSYGQMQALSHDKRDLRSWNHISGLYNDSDRRVSYGYHHVLGVGGSSLHFTGEAHRMNPKSMRMKSQFGVAADWPMTYADLDPYYQIAEETVGVAGPDQDKYRPRSAPYPQQAHALSYASQHLSKGFRKMGLALVPNSLAVLSAAKDGRPNCNYCGGCLRGCPRTDKGSIDVTYIRQALKSGKCEVRPGSRVLKLDTDTHDRITGVHYVDNTGTHFIPCATLIIACGAVETPRLLLTVKTPSSPNGLANESGEVGKNFMETLLWTSSALHPEPMGSHRGLPVDSICWDYNTPDAIPNVIGGCRFAPSQAESNLVGSINYATRVVGGWGKPHKAQMKQAFGNVLSITGIGESLPNSGSNVMLDPNKKDQFDMPLARINSHLNEMEIDRLAFMAKTCREILKAAGTGDIFEEFSSYDIFSSTHVFGTCRMGVNPATSVVNPWCQSHRWKNLYVIDASVFPSSGGGESPGLTIQALALRACNYIAENA